MAQRLSLNPKTRIAAPASPRGSLDAEPGPRGAATKLKIIEATERLVSERGIHVSAREILLEAGSANTAAVAYHFGNKIALLRSVFVVRTEQLEIARAEMLSDLVQREQTTDPRALSEALFLPIANLTDDNGNRLFAAFTFALEQAGLLEAVAIKTQTRNKLTSLLKNSLPGITTKKFEIYYSLAAFMFHCGLIKLDRLRNQSNGLSELEEHRYIQD